MRRLVLAGTLVVAAVGIASAGPTRKVYVESSPDGATIYLDEVDSGPKCDKTPCTFEAPLGQHTVICRRDLYEAEFVTIDVTRGKTPLPVKILLKSATGSIVIKSPKGASVNVDGKDAGKVPAHISVSSGEGHHVVITKGDKQIYEEFIEVKTSEEFEVTIGAPSHSSAKPPNNELTGEKPSGAGTTASESITHTEPSPEREAYITVGPVFDGGLRHFEYTENQTPSELLHEDELQSIVGAAVEFWPGRLLGVGSLSGLSLFARYELSPYQYPVGANPKLMDTVKVNWTSAELSLRQHWTFSDYGFELGAGYVDDNYGYKGDASDIKYLPSANYESIRIGLAGSYDAGVVQPYLAFEVRLPFGLGDLGANRFATANADGYRAALGMRIVPASWLQARAELAAMYYAWTFTQPDSTAAMRAGGAGDRIFGLSMTASYAH